MLENAAGQPRDPTEAYPNTMVVLLSVNKTYLLQPRDQGIIFILKYHYFKMNINSIILYCNEVGNVTTFWKRFTLKGAIQYIALARRNERGLGKGLASLCNYTFRNKSVDEVKELVQRPTTEALEK